MNNKQIIKRAATIAMSLLIAAGCGLAYPAAADDNSDIGAALKGTIAFNGADGGGMYTKGARAALDEGENIEVYHVTNLNDSGEGSFRDAVSSGNRIVVFDVSGMINLKSNVSISKNNMTILGQTAPGDGVTFRGDNIKVGADNVIVRYLRFRVGAQHMDGSVTPARDGMEITDNCQNVIIDHCSVSWGTDENLSAYAVKDVTIQNCIIAEALNQSVHDKGEHSYGAIWGGVNLSIHDNIIATHKSRNPKIGTSETVAMTAGYTDDKTLVDIYNNVFYNWGDKAGYGSENGAKTYLTNNIYKPGPATPAGKRARIFELSVGQKYKPNYLGSVYASGNRIYVGEGDPDYAAAQLVNENNWQDDLHTGVYVDNKVYSSADKSNMVITMPDEQYTDYDNDYRYALSDTEDVYERVLKNAGATLPKRDPVDERIVENVRNRTAPDGSKGSVGLVDDPADAVPEGQTDLYDALGYPIFAEETRGAEYDTDGDGIPDEWETKMGLNPENPLDGIKLGPDGHTWLEIYIEEAVTNPKRDSAVTIKAEDRIYTSAEEIQLTASAASSGISYADGVVTADGCDGKTAIAAVYNADGTLKEVKSAVIADGRADVGALLGGTVKAFVWDSLDGMQPAAQAKSAEIAKTEFYCNDELIAESETDTVSVKLPIGENDISAKVCFADGSYVMSAVTQICVIGDNTEDAVWKFDGAAAKYNDVFTLANGSSIMQTASSGKLVMKLGDTTTRYNGIETGLQATGADGTVIKLHKTMSDYKSKICYRVGDERGVWSEIPADKLEYFEIAIEPDGISLYAGENLAALEENLIYKSAAASQQEYELGAYAAGAGSIKSVSTLDMLKLVTDTTAPQAVLNVEDGSRLLLQGETVTVDVTSDGNVPITEVWLFMDGKPLILKNVNITGSGTVEFKPVFDTTRTAQLEAYAFDAELGKGMSETKNVLLSMDPAPWTLTDIGSSESEGRSYVNVTNDYTFKLADTSNGKIGGAADKFAYLNQQFNGNKRIYYRSRMQSADQFGVVIKTELTADGETYFFGGTKGEDGKPVYQLTKRDAGGEMELAADVTEVTGQSANLYFIVEKLDDKINIYQTENGATVYKTEKLLASIDCPNVGDSYYMGFGAVGGGNNPADAGWVGMEDISSLDGINSAGYSFDYGLDWLWQMQEANVLRPGWDRERKAMKLATDDSYTSPRYVFREYKHGEGNKKITACVSFILTGETPGLNIYFNANNKDEAFKAEINAEEPIILGGSETNTVAQIGMEYTLTITLDEGVTADMARMTLTTESGEEAINEEAPAQAFRSQINSKKAPVTDGIFFEPKVNAEGDCYITGLEMLISDSAIQKNVIAEHFWNFGASEEFAGLTALANGGEYAGLHVIGGAAVEGGRNKTIDGIAFTSRYKIGGAGDKTKKCVYFTVPAGTTDIVVYGESASSSAARGIVINDGEEHTTEVTSAQSASYSFTSDEEKTIYVYGNAGINLYGIKHETYTMSE